LNNTIPYGKSVDITVTATNGKKTVERTYNIKKKDPNETKKVYFDNSTMKWPYESTTGPQTVGIFVMCKTGTAASTKIGSYDSHKMTPVSGQTDLYSYDVPANTKYVKFNEGFIGSSYTDKSHVDAYGRCHLFHTFSECGGYCGRTMPETVVNYGTANSAANRENGGYELVGAMILRDLRFEDYGEYPVATLTNADTSLTEGGVEPTQAPTQPEPTKPLGRPILRGDADQDKVVCILDATMMQRHIANIKALSADGVLAADIDSSNAVEATDVTLLQRYLIGMGNQYKIEQIFYVDGDAPTPTPTTAPQPTTAPTPTQAPQPTSAPEPDPTDAPEPTTVEGPITFLLTDNFGWGSAYVYAWDANGTALCGEWPGAAQAETITNGYGETQFRCTVPEGAVGVILNNGNGAQTEDITDFGTYEGYWMDGTKNSQGHYLVTGWNS
uniref:starch-binding protein n=1 Tax=Ruminococcus sp. TaxID=41978 RepID=UPI003866FC95